MDDYLSGSVMSRFHSGYCFNGILILDQTDRYLVCAKQYWSSASSWSRYAAHGVLHLLILILFTGFDEHEALKLYRAMLDILYRERFLENFSRRSKRF